MPTAKKKKTTPGTGAAAPTSGTEKSLKTGEKGASIPAPKSDRMVPMEKERKLELIQRSLGIRHKLKVHDSMKQPDTHEETAVMMLAKWELEDELHAIEQLLAELRHENMLEKKHRIDKDNVPLVKKKFKNEKGEDEGV